MYPAKPNLPTAKEAKEKVDRIIHQRCINQLGDVETVINKAISEGRYECFYYKDLLPTVKEKLENNGYKIKRMNHRNEIDITISWK